jgi:hypothetical protein
MPEPASTVDASCRTPGGLHIPRPRNREDTAGQGDEKVGLRTNHHGHEAARDIDQAQNYAYLLQREGRTGSIQDKI